MRVIQLLFVVICVVLFVLTPSVLSRHHHHQHSDEATDALKWLDASAHHDSNSPLLESYRPDHDKNNQIQDKDDDDDDDDDSMKGTDSRSGLCRQYACPNFNSTTYPTFMKRTYANVTAACTTIRTFQLGKHGELEAFKRLYEYFGGENSGSTKINMTVPVVRYVEPGMGNLNDGSHPNVTICFFLPDSLGMNPPVPKNMDVHIFPCSFDVMVHPFEGWSTHENVGKALGRFQLILHLAGINFNKQTYIHAAYTEPWILWPRYNEIWLMTSSEPRLFSSHTSIYGPGGPARYRVHHGKHHNNNGHN